MGLLLLLLAACQPCWQSRHCF